MGFPCIVHNHRRRNQAAAAADLPVKTVNICINHSQRQQPCTATASAAEGHRPRVNAKSRHTKLLALQSIATRTCTVYIMDNSEYDADCSSSDEDEFWDDTWFDSSEGKPKTNTVRFDSSVLSKLANN